MGLLIIPQRIGRHHRRRNVAVCDAQLPVGMTAEKLEQTTGQGFEMTVQPLDETAGEYQAFAALTETDEEAALLDMQVLKVGMRYNGVTLNLEDCDIKGFLLVSVPGITSSSLTFP